MGPGLHWNDDRGTAMNDGAARLPGSRLATVAFLALLALLFAGFTALGCWQLQRLHWKRDLIARVDSRVHAAAVAAPVRTEWPALDAGSAEYRRVFVEGQYLPGLDTHVDALTGLGPGDWVLSPLRTGAGDIVLVNRGFVPAGARGRAAPVPAGPVRIEGLLRLDEPGGRILRKNAPAQDRWFSRDTAAIAAARGLDGAAPWFIDAAFDANAPEWPRGGMTVVRFRDHHLQYALTWFALALMVAFAAWRVLSGDRCARRGTPDHAGIDVTDPSRPDDRGPRRR